ncbi:hypothetical protein BGZ60DRAFT_357039, partial [Tricladium varicosporioides]
TKPATTPGNSKILSQVREISTARNASKSEPSSSKGTPASPVNTKPIPTSKPKIPIAALNSEIVSNITTRAGARPNQAGAKPLPQNYKSAARKVTMTIVALPIAIVTSYVLYQRLILGQDKSELIR